jgi:hypothetical protein
MKRKFKAIGLSLVAVFAMSAVVASAAQADEFHSTSAPAFFTSHSAEANHKFTVTKPAGTVVSSVTCTTYQFSGTSAVKTSSSVELHPTYSNCKLSTGLAMKVEVPEACNYKIILPAAGTKATVDVVNCAGGIKIVGVGCTITVPAQTGLEHLQLSNNAGKTDINAEITVTGIAATQTAGCPGGVGAAIGDYSGTATVLGYSDAAHTKTQSIWVE